MVNPSLPPLLDDSDALLRLWLDPRGRIGRATWWLYGVAGLSGLAALLGALLDIARFEPDRVDAWVGLLLAWPAAALSAKRWHDRDRSAWWVLLVFVPVIGQLWLLIDNGCVRGTPGRNRFGPEPGG